MSGKVSDTICLLLEFITVLKWSLLRCLILISENEMTEEKKKATETKDDFTY